MDAHKYFLEISQDILHSDSTYIDHCVGIYNILKKLNCSEEICLAGLYHSIYGTEYFKLGQTQSRETIQNLIGINAERLVHIFCELRDRHTVIETNRFGFDKQTHRALVLIEYANLKEQASRIDDLQLTNLCSRFLDLLIQNTNENIIDQYQVEGKDIWVFDNLLTDSDVEHINHYCLNSLYRPEHSSTTALHYEIDSRFVATLTENDLFNTKLMPYISTISNFLKQDLFIGKSYINHYTLMTNVSKHTDSSEPNHYTILVFCNKYWESTWGGEITFYDSYHQGHTIFEFKPKRIIIFDSRIAHKVMPLTQSARKDRYSLAIKTSTNNGLESFKQAYPSVIEVKHD